MGSSGFQAQARQLGGNVSFAQSLSGSQPATSLDPSYVLSNSHRVISTLSRAPRSLAATELPGTSKNNIMWNG